MYPNAESPGTILRRLRLQNNKTLKAAAAPMGLSTAALSRLERGSRAVERSDIEAAIAVYNLSPWDSYLLYNAAGIVPDTMIDLSDRDFVEHGAEFLRCSAMPALIVDRYGYYRAWNGLLQSMWNLPLEWSTHWLDDLFSQAVRETLGGNWRKHALHILNAYYVRTLTTARETDYGHLLTLLAERLGEEFVKLWNEALVTPAPRDMSGALSLNIVGHYNTPVGVIDYAMASIVLNVPTLMGLWIFVPTDVENMERHIALLRQVGHGTVYTGPEPGRRLQDALQHVAELQPSPDGDQAPAVISPAQEDTRNAPRTT